MMYHFFVSIAFLFFRDPESVHRLALVALRVIGLPLIRDVVRALCLVKSPALEQTVVGIRFPNPVGLAAGFDKGGEALPGLAALGFGFIEAGTVTLHAQPGNPRPRMFRFPRDQALINSMGFNNEGTTVLAARVRHHGIDVPLGLSIGKSKVTELKDAAAEYAESLELLYDHGDYFVVNVSSPNTSGLRELQDKKFLIDILSAMNRYREGRERKPVFVKIAPDLTNEAIDDVLAVIKELHADGIIATNTTIGRDGLSVPTAETGGMSGKPLRNRATEIIRYVHAKAPQLPIIGVGGIFTAEDAYEKIRAGASLVQIYTGFIYEGPFAARNINRGLARLLKRDGYKNISEAVGAG